MQKTRDTQHKVMRSHRLIDQQEMKQWCDPHCPSQQMLDNGQCWLRYEMVSLESVNVNGREGSAPE